MRRIVTARWEDAVVLGVLLVALVSVSAAVAADQAAVPMLKVAQNTPLGNILTDDKGMTLYIFKKDKPGESVCEGQCAQKWPPVIVPEGTQTAAPAGFPGRLTTIERKDGTYQMAHDGMP